jgi:hypothetical protein
MNLPRLHEPVVGRWGADSLGVPINGRSKADSELRNNDSHFQLLTIDDLEARPEPSYLIDGILPAGSNVMLYGPSGGGKSFLALDWALTLASWKSSWMGRAVLNPGPVVYVAAEGLASLRLRIRAWMHHNQCDAREADIAFVERAVQLLESADPPALLQAVEEEVYAARRWQGGPAMIVLDTLARCMIGADENSVKDVSRAIASIDYLRQRTEATVLLVHHSQKHGELERGSSALRAAQDTMMSLRSAGGVLLLESTKVKDGPPLERTSLALQPVLESCVITSCQLAPAAAGLKSKQRECLVALDRVAMAGAATLTAWMQGSTMPKTTFHRARKALVEGGYVEQTGGVGYAITVRGKVELVSSAPGSRRGAAALEVPSPRGSHTPAGGGTQNGTGTSWLSGMVIEQEVEAEEQTR